MKRLATALMALAAATAQADEIVLHVYSWHTNDVTTSTGELLNNANVGLGYRWSNGWNVGAYYNSYRSPSVYVAKDWMFTENFGIMLGVANGYKEIGYTQFVTANGIAPLAAFVFRKKITKDVVLGIQAVPSYGRDTSGVVHGTLSFLH